MKEQKTKTAKAVGLKILLCASRYRNFSLTAEYKKEPPRFKEYYKETKTGERDYSFIARPNGLNGRKRKAYLIDIHITEEDIAKLILKKLRQKKLPLPDKIS